MNKLRSLAVLSLIVFLAACGGGREEKVERPMDPWAFRSVLDKNPRMLTLALDTACYISYDLASGTLYKAWKGGVILEGTVYTDKKNVQPTSWGKAYLSDSLRQTSWELQINGEKEPSQFSQRGYVLMDGWITLKHALVPASGDTIHIEESPEFIRGPSGNPGLERIFVTSNLDEGMKVSLVSPDTTIVLTSNGRTQTRMFFDPLPPQSPPDFKGEYDHLGLYWMENSDCFTCHEIERDNVGPSFLNIASRYPDDKQSLTQLAEKVKQGGSGNWGTAVMNPLSL